MKKTCIVFAIICITIASAKTCILSPDVLLDETESSITCRNNISFNCTTMRAYAYATIEVSFWDLATSRFDREEQLLRVNLPLSAKVGFSRKTTALFGDASVKSITMHQKLDMPILFSAVKYNPAFIVGMCAACDAMGREREAGV